MTHPTHPEILVVGEALMDIRVTAAGEVHAPGGGPANVALGLGRRGLDVALLTHLAGDAYGSVIAQHLRRSGVEVLPESFSARATGTARATVGATGAATYEFDITWDLPSAPKLAPRLIHTGSLAAFLAPGADALLPLLDAYPDATLTFDPNIRAALIGPADAARARFDALARRASVLKLSDEDAEFLFPGSGADDVLDAILELGPGLVALTRGRAGATLATGAARVTVAAAPVNAPVADTIGAGDTFMAALIAEPAVRAGAIPEPAELGALGARAAQASAITVTRVGADLPWSRDLPSPH